MTLFFYYLSFIFLGIAFGSCAMQFYLSGSVRIITLIFLFSSAVSCLFVERPEIMLPDNENILDHNFEYLKQ
jgi:hypothetical protein